LGETVALHYSAALDIYRAYFRGRNNSFELLSGNIAVLVNKRDGFHTRSAISFAVVADFPLRKAAPKTTKR
jgi:hypothetical protein